MASLASPIASTTTVVSRSAISGGDGGSNSLVLQLRSSLSNVQKTLESQNNQNVQQTQEISSLKSTINSLRNETVTLNSGLQSITTLIQNNNTIEKRNANAEIESERRLSESTIRLGKESALERKIESSLATPIQALETKVTGIFGRIGGALLALFSGWLTNQGIEAIKAAEKGNKEKLEEIKNNVIKTIGFSAVALGAIKIGFDTIIKTITGITGKIGSIVLRLATAPLKALKSTLGAAPIIGPLFGGGKKPTGGGGGGKPTGGGGLLKGAGNIVKGLAGPLLGGAALTGLDIAQGEDPARAVAGATTGMIGSTLAFVGGSMLPIPGSGVVAGALAYDPAAQFGKEMYDNFYGTPKKPQAKVSPTTPKVENKKPTLSPTIVGPAESLLQTSTMPQVKTEPTTLAEAKAIATPAAPATLEPQTAPVVQPQTPIIPQPSVEMTKNFQMAWDNRNSGFARGRIESSWDNMSVEQQQQAKIWAKSKGYDWTEMKLVDKAQIDVTPPLESAKVQTLPKNIPNVGEIAEPAPNVIMLPFNSGSNQQKSSISQAPTNSSDVPLISSSNPDNFYVLYSQLTYNVVV